MPVVEIDTRVWRPLDGVLIPGKLRHVPCLV